MGHFENFRQISKRLDELESDMIEFQKSITAIPALSPVNGGKGEWEKVMSIKNYLEKLGVAELQQIDAPDPDAVEQKRPNLIAKIKGKRSDKTIWFLVHTDVVPEGDLSLWETDPWKAEVKDGKLFGRGTEDNQQSLTSSVFTLKAFLDEAIRPEYDVGVILAADEETGSKYGVEYLLEQNPYLFQKQDIIVVPDAGEPDASMIEVAEKSIIWLRFQTQGAQCHASLPGHGNNAFRAGSHLVVRLGQLYEKFEAQDDVFVPPISTFEPTKKEANVPNVNTIPGEDVFYLDCRLLPRYSVDEFFKEIRRICDEIEIEFSVKIKFEPVQLGEAAPATDKNAEVVDRLKKAINEVYDVEAKPMGIGGGTFAAIIRRSGFDVAVWSTLDDVCHQPNEYCVISNMVNDAKVFAHVCLQK